MKGKEHQACSRAAGVMLIVCGVPVLVVGLVLVFALKNYPPVYIPGLVMLGVAGVLLIGGLAASISSCVMRHKKKVEDYSANQYRMRRGSQTTCYTTATVDTVATRLTVAPPMSAYCFPEDGETPPPAYISTVHAWEHGDLIGQRAYLPVIGPGQGPGQEPGLQRF